MKSRLWKIPTVVRRGAGPLTAAAVLAGGAALTPSAAARRSSDAPVASPSAIAARAPAPVVISPLPGTPDANPATQISFLGVPAAQLSDIVVDGSVSGEHAGQLRPYSTHDGASFIPSAPFAAGERVTVSARVGGAGRTATIGTNFRVAHPYTLPAPVKTTPVPAKRADVMRFHSAHDLEPPAVRVTTKAADASLGDVFISPDSGPGQSGPMIIGANGALVWFDPLPNGTLAFDLNVQTYRGHPVLTWWQGEVVEGHGQGLDMIESSDYRPLAVVRAGNGLHADLHDFELTPQGTAWITAYEPEHWNLRVEGGLAHSLIDDGVVQEIDVRTGLVMFEWHALGHVAVSDTYMHYPHYPATVLDYFHLNSVQPVAGGDVLISSRNTWTTYLIDQATGAIVWRLGGKQSTFDLGSGVHFAWQHDAKLQPNGTISLFDNESFPDEASQSRAVDIALDDGTHTASLVEQYTYPGAGILSESQGDTQPLPNGDVFVGWGQVGEATEFDSAGAVTFDLRLPAPTGSYRAFRFPWSGQPRTRPALRAATPGRKVTQLWASWNGATDVAAWRVLAGGSPGALKPVRTYRSRGFETAITATTTARYLVVQALSVKGAVLRNSDIART